MSNDSTLNRWQVPVIGRIKGSKVNGFFDMPCEFSPRCYRLCGIIIYFFNLHLDLMSAQQVCQIFVRLKDLYKKPT